MSIRSTLQTIIIPKSEFTQSQAIRWLANHGYNFNKIDVKPNTYRFRQTEPLAGVSYYSVELPNGVILVYME